MVQWKPRMPHAVHASALALACLCGAILAAPADADQSPRNAAGSAASLLSPGEREMNCKRMAGRMQVRILELRGAGVSRTGSDFAQTMQSTAQPIFGGTRRGADTAGDNARDIAKLREMNTILKSRGCPHYDLDAELAKDAKAPTPRLVKGAAAARNPKSDQSAGSGGTDLKAKAEALKAKAKAWMSTTSQKSKPAARP